MERQGKDLPAPEKAAEIAEYAFLQDRLSFWLAYEYTPPDAQGNLRSAAMGLYRGGVAAGIAGPGHLPYSMLVAGAEASFLNNAPPPRLRLRGAEGEPTSKIFDLFNLATGEAVSVKTLNTVTINSIKNPQSIYSRLSGYVDAAADYEPRVETDLSPQKIESRTIHLAVPEYTSPTQWRYLYWAILYGKERGVKVVITRIKQ